MPGRNYTLDDFNFTLPEKLIAQYPSRKRENCRLLVLHRDVGSIEHAMFNRLGSYFHEGDLLVFNNTRVIYGRIRCTRESGGTVELVLSRKVSLSRWQVITNRTKRLKQGEELTVKRDPAIRFTVLGRVEDYIEIESNRDLDEEQLRAIGDLALPPYIRRESESLDSERYQTVYADQGGAAAAPTAGLHFSERLMEALSRKGIELAFLTLDVSWGTFKPVREQRISDHVMHSESYHLPEDTAIRINQAREQGKRITAVGTTSLRVLEATFKEGKNISGAGETDIFIYPPRQVKSVDSMITNFHTPFSTLLMLVAAFAGYDTIMRTYREAVHEEYLFFSYGDAMLII